MRTGIVAFLMGNISLLYWPYLPDISSTFVIIFSAFAVISVVTGLLYKAHQYIVSSASTFLSFFETSAYKKPFFSHMVFLILCVFCGFIYTSLYINLLIPKLDLGQLEGETIQVIGLIDSIPYKTETKYGFDFYIKARKTQSLQSEQLWDSSFKGKVKLSWYSSYDTKNKTAKTNDIKKGTASNLEKSAADNLHIGQYWKFDIRLKKPNGLLNPGGFDYEKWLYQNRILAAGYVRSAQRITSDDLNSPSIAESLTASGLFTGSGLFTSSGLLSALRQQVADQLDSALPDHPYKGLIKALSIGYRHDLTTEQWRVFLRTGTNHLVAISGLHIGLMSSLIWFLVNGLWCMSSTLNMKIPAYYAASFFALLSAVLYAALAGFAIPTQRALIMLLVVFCALMLKREIAPAYVLSLAMLLVLLFDPLSPLSLGFWLSFTAVAVILFSLSGRLGAALTKTAKLLQLGRIQGAIFIGLLPLMIILFHQFSMVSPLANLIAVPLMSIIIVPVTLLAAGLLFIFEPLGHFLFEQLKWPMDALFFYLEQLNRLPESYYFLAETSLLMMLLVFIACFWLLMPKGWPGRWLGLILLLPVFMNSSMSTQRDEIPEGEVQVNVLDVGQGLAVVLNTRHHTLLYDTGDKFSEQFNMADMVIIPFLRFKGIAEIDKLILSHADRDHAGSYAELQQLSIKEVLSGEPDRVMTRWSGENSKPLQHKIKQCKDGQQWQWDGVSFNILSPVQPGMAAQMTKNNKANNKSCVILITTASGQSVLLTGDIEKKVEKQILNNYPGLIADVLLVPHHGSKTSSSMLFLQQLQPEIALFSYGYRNRFHHPHQKIVQRYKKMNINLFNTSNGSIDINRDITNNSWLVKQHRIENRRFWHRTPESL